MLRAARTVNAARSDMCKEMAFHLREADVAERVIVDVDRRAARHFGAARTSDRFF